MFFKSSIKKKDIDTLNEEDLELKIIKYLNEKIKNLGNNSNLNSLSKGMQMFYSTWWMESEVNNGGFSQYFWNSASRFAKEAYLGYLAIGAKEYAALVGEGMNLYIKNHSFIEKHQKNGTIEAYKELEKQKIFEDLDKKFFDIEKNENIVHLRRLYINAHAKEFITE